MAASVHARLLNLARSGGRTFNDLLQLYLMERFLFRLSQSRHAEKFILKGAMLMRAWDPTLYRTTRDIDLLGRVANRGGAVAEAIATICALKVAPDGLDFDSRAITTDAIAADGDYQGIRATVQASLGNARLSMRVDVGFGDRVTPPPRVVVLPALLDMPAPRLKAYPAETVIAEKLEIMLRRGHANTRLKDFHDLWWLSTRLPFDGRLLGEAIRVTCEHRGTLVPAIATALTPAFAEEPAKAAQWHAFRRRQVPCEAPEDLRIVTAQIAELLTPIMAAVSSGAEFRGAWQPPGPWRPL